MCCHKLGHLREKLWTYGWKMRYDNIVELSQELSAQGRDWGFTDKEVRRTVETMRGRLFIPTSDSAESTTTSTLQGTTQGSASSNTSPGPLPGTSLIDQSAASSSSHPSRSTNDQTPNLTVASFFNPDGAASSTIRLFTGRSFLSLPPNQAYHLVPDSKRSSTASTQTEKNLKTGKAMKFACPMCPLKCRDSFDFMKHIDRMHTPHW